MQKKREKTKCEIKQKQLKLKIPMSFFPQKNGLSVSVYFEIFLKRKRFETRFVLKCNYIIQFTEMRTIYMYYQTM